MLPIGNHRIVGIDQGQRHERVLVEPERRPAADPEVGPRLRRGGRPPCGARVGRARGVSLADRRGGGQDRALLLRLLRPGVARRFVGPDAPGGAGGAVLGRRRHRPVHLRLGPRGRRHRRCRPSRTGAWSGCRNASAPRTTSSSARSACRSPMPGPTSARSRRGRRTTRRPTSGCSTAPRRGSPTAASPTSMSSWPPSIPSSRAGARPASWSRREPRGCRRGRSTRSTG